MPDDIHAQLRQAAGKNGNVPIRATIGRSTFATTTMSMGQQRWFFAVKASVRQAENITVGDTVAVSLVPDFDRIKA